MRRAWWRFRLAILLIRYGYRGPFEWVNAWRWTAEEDWIVHFEDGESPMDAIREDWSYQ